MGLSVVTLAVTVCLGRDTSGVTSTRAPDERLNSPTALRYFFRWDSAYSSGLFFFWYARSGQKRSHNTG